MGLWEKFKNSVVAEAAQKPAVKPEKYTDDIIVFGALMSIIAEADEQFSSEEQKTIEKILVSEIGFQPEDVPLILTSAKEAARKRVDLQELTREINKNRDYDQRLRVLEDLFRVAFSDKFLHFAEDEALRRISALLWISHKDFINTRDRVKSVTGDR